MWVVDLIIEAQRAKQRREKRTWRLDIEALLQRQNERKIKERAENVKLKR